MLDIFGSVAEMRKFVDDHRGKKWTVFDLDWSGDDENNRYKNMMLTMMDEEDDPKIDHHRPKILSPFFKSTSKFMRMYDDPNDGALINELHQRMGNVWLNHSAIGDVNCRILLSTHPAMNVLIQTCDPNVLPFINRQSIVFIALQPITAGSALRMSKDAYTERSERKCCDRYPDECVPCRNDDWWNEALAVEIQMTSYFTVKNYFERNDPKILSNQLSFLKSCADYVNKNFKHYYANAEKRKLIAARLLSIRSICFYIGCSFPFSVPLSAIFSTPSSDCCLGGLEGYMKLLNFNFE